MKVYHRAVKRLEEELEPRREIAIGEWDGKVCRVDGEAIDEEQIQAYRDHPITVFIEVAKDGFGRL